MPEHTLVISSTPVRTIAELQVLMEQRLGMFDAVRDHRAAFLRVYMEMTGRVRQELKSGFFLDPAWVERVALRFAWWYFDALDRYERGDQAPPAWEYAFNVAVRKEGFLLQDVLLGMNAHINNDLPLVVAAILREEGDAWDRFRSVRRRFDHDLINRVLYNVIPHVETELSRHYGRLILPLGRLMGRLDQALATYGLKNWRDTVWRNAQFLLAADGAAEQERVIRMIEQDALDVARRIGQVAPLSWCRPLAPWMRRWRLF